MSGDLDREPRPFSKEQQLSRAGKRHHRLKAGSARWAQIAEAKQGPCRVCAAAPPNQLHHLLARSQGGSDTESNIAPLCLRCHALVEGRDPIACQMLVASLSDAEYSLLIETGGEGVMERRYGIRYERA